MNITPIAGRLAVTRRSLKPWNAKNVHKQIKWQKKKMITHIQVAQSTQILQPNAINNYSQCSKINASKEKHLMKKFNRKKISPLSKKWNAWRSQKKFAKNELKFEVHGKNEVTSKKWKNRCNKKLQIKIKTLLRALIAIIICSIFAIFPEDSSVPTSTFKRATFTCL